MKSVDKLKLRRMRADVAELLSDLVDERDSLPPRHPDKPQYRAVAVQVEQAIIRLDSAIQKAGL